jgi:hypothetical protein
MTAIPTTKYAKSGDVHIAYQVVSEGAQNLVLFAFLAVPRILLAAHPPRPTGHRTVGPRE